MIPTLVISPEEAAGRLARPLESEGFDATFVPTGQQGLALAARRAFRLILLDWKLPDMPGTEVCRQLKQESRVRDVPIVVVTEIDTEIDRVVAFELGAIDYITSPFSVRELLLRLRVAVFGKVSPSDAHPRVGNGAPALDYASRHAVVQGEEVALSPREFDLLCTLCAKPGVVQSRTQLRDAVWGGSLVSLRTVDASVKRIRRKLAAGRHAIETVRGVGYRFRDTPPGSRR